MAMPIFIMITALVIWGIYAIFTQGSASTEKQPGNQLSERGVNLVQVFFWIVVFIFIMIGFAQMVNGN
jgi:cell division protein FtsW (lipid II flippase)